MTGLDDVPLTVPRRLGEILREPVLLGAAIGEPLSLWLLRRRAALPAAAGVFAIVAFALWLERPAAEIVSAQLERPPAATTSTRPPRR